MKITSSEIERIIIYECLCLLDGEKKDTSNLIENIEKLAKLYHITLRPKKYAIKKYIAFKKFVRNSEGYNISLLRLWNVFK